MTTKVTIIIDNPADPEAFEAGFAGVKEAAKALQGLTKMESGKVWPKEDGTPAPAHRVLDFYFENYEAASNAVSTPEAGAFFGQLGGLGGTFSGLFTELEE